MDAYPDLEPDKAAGTFLHTSPAFSPLFTREFTATGDLYEAWLYRLQECSDFGVLFPHQLLPLPWKDLRELGCVQLRRREVEDLKDFLFEMWSDLLRLSKERAGEASKACYLVVPLGTAEQVDWEVVAMGIGKKPRQKLTDVDPHSLPNSIWQANYKNKATWILVDAFLCCRVSTRQFLTCLLGRKHPKLEELCDKYKWFGVSDLILEESFDVESVKNFRGLIASGIASSCDFFKPFIFAKPTKTIIQDGESRSTDQQCFPHGTPLLHFDLLDKFYLSREQWEMARRLPEVLIRLENASLVMEFAEKYGRADFYDLREALTTTQLDILSNFENLENMGDTVLKFLTTLLVYRRHPDKTENSLTSLRTGLINNNNLKQVSKTNHIYRFIRTVLVKSSKWRPPFYDGKMGPADTAVQNHVNEKTMADVVEALIGAYYLSGGTLAAVDFLKKIKLLKVDSHWETCLSYLESSPLVFISQEEISAFDRDENSTMGQLLAHEDIPYPCGDRALSLEDCQTALGYTFRDPSLLTEALTQRSVNSAQNYERLEFLGDAVVDVAALTNVFPFLRADTSPRELTNIKHILVNNQTLSRLTIAAGLHRYCAFTEELTEKVDEYLARLTWTDNPLLFGIYQDEPPKQLNDVFEALIGAVLIDSGSLQTAAEVTLHHIRPIVVYLVKHHKSVQKNIVNRLIEAGQKRGVKVRLVAESHEGGSFAMVQDAEDQVLATALADTLEVAKHQAILSALEELEKLPVKE